MPVSPALHVVFRALAMTVVLAPGLAGCDESQQPSAITLLQAASNPDGDGQQARASLAEGSFQMYFGDRFAEEQRGLMQQPQVAQAQAPTF